MKDKLGDQWRDNFRDAAGENGFFEELGTQHRALFVPQGPTLVVSFENLDDARQNPDNRLPWGMDFMASRGWSALGMMAHGWTWYRDPAVYEFFDRLRDEKFFDQFERVVFYGTSMGGYAATAFAAACPGADVVAVSPQATLSRDITVGWESRFRRAWIRDFDGPYGYGPEGILNSRKTKIFYDPTIAVDSMHVSLYRGENVEKYACRHYGHGMLTTWRHMGVLSKIISGCINDTVTRHDIFCLLRERRLTPFYQKRLLSYLLTLNRPHLVAQYCQAVIDSCAPQRRPKFKGALNQAKAIINNKK